MKSIAKLFTIFCFITTLAACSRASENDVSIETKSPLPTKTDSFGKTDLVSVVPQKSETPTPPINITPENIETVMAIRQATRWAKETSTQAVKNVTKTALALTPSETPTITPTPTSTRTRAPTITRGPTQTPPPTSTIPASTLNAEATLEAFGSKCEAPARDYGAELSPDGNWIATSCRGKDGVIDSHLRVISLEGDIDWSIHYADYANDTEYSRRNMIYTRHWSKDGRYLYATSPSIGSGCCWIGWDVLLVRLNLETGKQTEIVNFIVDGWPTMTEFSFSPSDNYLLYIPQDGKDNLYLLDLNTWKQRIIEIEYENTGAGHSLMSNNDQKIILVIAQYPEEYQGDLRYGWLVVIDLESGSQKKLIGGMDYFETPIPIRWVDDDHVLLRNLWINDDMYWLLNIHTAELTEIENP